MLVRLSLAGLLILAHGCRSKAATGGPDGGGHGGGAGAAGTARSGGCRGGNRGRRHECGRRYDGRGRQRRTTGSAGAGGTTGVGGGPGGSNSDGGTNPDEGGADRRPDPGDAGPFYPLDMNDVTILAPLPPSGATPVLLRGTDLADDGTALVPRALFDRLVKEKRGLRTRPHAGDVRAPPAGRGALRSLRSSPAGRVRGSRGRADASRVPADLHGRRAPRTSASTRSTRSGTTRLPAPSRRCATSRGPPRRRPACCGSAPPSARRIPRPTRSQLRAFVKRYGGEARLIRLTMNAQPEIFAQVALGAPRRREEGGRVRRHHDRGLDRDLGVGVPRLELRRQTESPTRRRASWVRSRRPCSTRRT